jgi:hypothetical protein
MPALGTALGLPFVRKAGPLTPPTVAPVLMVDAEPLSVMASLDWTFAGSTSSPGFGFRIYIDVNSGGFTELTTVSAATFTATHTQVPTPEGETYTFKVTAFNDAGEGPESNAAGVVLPGL